MFSQNILPTIFCWSVECRFYNITYLLIFCVRFAFIRTNQIFCSWSERRWETLIIEVKPSHLIFGNFRTGPALGLVLGSERNFPVIQWTSCNLSSLLFRGKVTHSGLFNNLKGGCKFESRGLQSQDSIEILFLFFSILFNSHFEILWIGNVIFRYYQVKVTSD